MLNQTLNENLHALIGLIRREWAFQNKFFGQRISRMVLGPLMGASTAWLLYGGLFQKYGDLSFGQVQKQNFQTWLFISFLLHSYLNQGYYFFSNKILNDWWSKTLGLFFLSPARGWVLFFGISAIEFFRALVLTLAVAGGLSATGHLSGDAFLQLLISFPAVLGIGLTLGVIKGGIAVLRKGKGEVFDPVFWLVILTSCLYVPRQLLPSPLAKLVGLNPIYHLQQTVLRESNPGTEIDWNSTAIAWIVFGLLLGLVLWLVQKLRYRVLEKSYS